MREDQYGEASVRTEYRGNGKGRRNGILCLAIGVLSPALAWGFRGPLDPIHMLWIVSLAAAALCLPLGGLQLWAWHRFLLTIGREGVTVHQAGRTRVLPWEAISRLAIEPFSLRVRAVSLKVWPAPAASLPHRPGERTGDGAVAVCQLDMIDGTAEELAASVRHFAPPAVTEPDR